MAPPPCAQSGTLLQGVQDVPAGVVLFNGLGAVTPGRAMSIADTNLSGGHKTESGLRAAFFFNRWVRAGLGRYFAKLIL